jgi:hypothetical protein
MTRGYDVIMRAQKVIADDYDVIVGDYLLSVRAYGLIMRHYVVIVGDYVMRARAYDVRADD